MNVSQNSSLFLKNLYLKSKDDLSYGFDERVIGQLSNLNGLQAKNVQNYLKEKGLITEGRHKQDYNIYLTALGIDEVEKLLSNSNFIIIKFLEHRYVPSGSRAVTKILFYYNVIKNNEIQSTNSIVAIISDVLGMNWGYPLWSQNPEVDYKDLAKILLQYVKDKIVEKIKEDTLNGHEELVLLTTTHPDKCPYLPDNLTEVLDAEYLVEINQKNLTEEIKGNKLAASIIELRDLINAIFYQKHKSRLLMLSNERNLLDFFKSATSEEEFSHRISSLGEISRNFNIDILRKVTSINDTDVKSIQLLSTYFKNSGKDASKTVEILKHIGRIRQGYPIHSDNTGIAQSLAFFQLPYPIIKYEEAWLLLLNHYFMFLKNIYDLLNEIRTEDN